MSSKETKFKKLGESRVRKTLKMIKLVANLANKARYDYSKRDADKIIRALTNELTAARARFKSKSTSENIEFTL